MSYRIEDHDDLIPIFDKHNNHLTDIYGMLLFSNVWIGFTFTYKLKT